MDILSLHLGPRLLSCLTGEHPGPETDPDPNLSDPYNNLASCPKPNHLPL